MDLLGLSATNKPSCGRCAFERDCAEQKAREYGCNTRLFAGGLDGESESGSPRGSIGGKRMECMVLARVSPVQSRLFLGHCFGAYATPGGRLALLLCYAPSGLRFPPSADPP
jgi:hypothetical protein